MVDLGADYSDARPGGAALKAKGVAAVGRYLAADSRGITTGEYADLTAHGIGLWLVYEGKATGMLSGYAKGAADAMFAQQQILAVGLPVDSVIYATADFDVSQSQFGACDNYLAGFGSVIGRGRVGIYGGTYYLNHVHDVGLASWFWESASTSFAHGEARSYPLHLQQTTKTPPLPGTDHNFIYDASTLAGVQVITDITTALEADNMLLITAEGRLPLLIGPLGSIELTDPATSPVDKEQVDVGTGILGGKAVNARQYDVIHKLVNDYAANAKLFLTQSS